MKRTIWIALAACALAAPLFAQSDAGQGTLYRSPGGTTLRLLLDDGNVGPEVTVGEMMFPPNTDTAGAKVVVIWVPGDEGKKIAARWKKEP